MRSRRPHALTRRRLSLGKWAWRRRGLAKLRGAASLPLGLGQHVIPGRAGLCWPPDGRPPSLRRVPRGEGGQGAVLPGGGSAEGTHRGTAAIWWDLVGSECQALRSRTGGRPRPCSRGPSPRSLSVQPAVAGAHLQVRSCRRPRESLCPGPGGCAAKSCVDERLCRSCDARAPQ